MKQSIIAIAISHSLSAFCCAQVTERKNTDGIVATDHFGLVIQTLGGLLVVLGLILVIAWLVRRFGQNGLFTNSSMKILASLSLGPRERVIIVSVGEQQFLLGVAPGCINTLHVFDHPVVDNQASQSVQLNFNQLFRTAIKQGAVQ